MAQGEFTKEEAEETMKSAQEVMVAMPKRKQMEYVGHFNDIFLFLEAAKAAAPPEVK